MIAERGLVLANKYRLDELLGRGGMGEVWRAWHLGLDVPVAVKLMSESLSGDADAAARFHREARAAATLRSPHVVQILDFGLDERTQALFMAMELLRGENLRERLLREHTLSAAETAEHVARAARALALAHSAGIVHRDLKPANLFITTSDSEPTTKVLDFGIAKWQRASGAEGLTRTGATLGTAHYMSPEQLERPKDVDHRSDLWALGIIACECITGRLPFEADSFPALALLICGGAPARPSDLARVPDGFDAWFGRATARDPERRFPSADALAEELTRVCAARTLLHGQTRSRRELSSLALGQANPTRTPRASQASAHDRGRGRLRLIASMVGVGLLVSVLLLKRTPFFASSPTLPAGLSAAPVSAPSVNVGAAAPSTIAPALLPMAAPASLTAQTGVPLPVASIAFPLPAVLARPPTPPVGAGPGKLWLPERRRATPIASLPVKGNVTASGKKLYHLPECPAYGRVTIRPSRGERWFASETDALRAGWHKAGDCP